MMRKICNELALVVDIPIINVSFTHLQRSKKKNATIPYKL